MNGLIFRLYGINLENDYQIFYKKGKTLNDKDSEFIQYGGTYKKNIDTIVLSGISIEYSTQYWFKIVDTVTNEYLIKNLITHQSKAFHPYDNIEFTVMVSGKTVTLYDDTLGNNASVINNKPKTYNIYSGDTETSFINGTTIKIGTGTTDKLTKKIFEYESPFDDDFYIFLVHGDGYNLKQKKQGGFNVRKVSFNPFVEAPSNTCYFDVEAVVDTVSCTTDFNIEYSTVTPPVTSTNTSTPSLTETPPTDYLNDNNIYYIGLLSDYNKQTNKFEATVDGGKIDIIDSYKNSGFNALHIELILSYIYKNNIDDTPTWNDENYNVKEKLTRIKESGLPLFLRVTLIYERLYSNNPAREADTYFLGKYTERNQWEQYSDEYNGRESFTLADDLFRQKMADRFYTIVKYAYDILGSQLKWVSPTLSYTSEWGYTNRSAKWYKTDPNNENSWVANHYMSIMGYNDKNTSKFQQFLKLKYQDISKLNENWGTSYTNTNFSDITLPKINKEFNNGTGHTDIDFFDVFSGKKGEDFYLYRTNNLLVFAKELKDKLKSINQRIIFTCEIGSATGNNVISQGNLDIEGYAKVFELIKGDSSIIGNNNEANSGWDRYSRFNIMIADEVSNFDIETTDLDQYYTNLFNRVKSSLSIGQQFFLMLDSPTHYKKTWNKSLSAISAVKNEIGLTKKSKLTTTNNLTLTLSEILSSKNNGYITQKWNNASGSKTLRFNIIVNGFEYINDNIIISPTKTPTLTDTPPTTSTPTPITTEKVFCQEYTNHGGTEPHIFTQKSQSDGKNYIVGNIITYSTPQYRVGDSGDWNDMVLGGTLFNGQYFVLNSDPDIPEKMYFFKTNYVDNVTIYLRPRSGGTTNCGDSYIKPDARKTYLVNYLGVEKFTLPTLDSNFTAANIDIKGFNFSSDIGKEATNNPNEQHAIYRYEFAGQWDNLKIRIDGAEWRTTDKTTKTYYGRPINANVLPDTNLPSNTPKKDFYMDITQNDGATFDRYIVRRCSAGGHFANILTLTRVKDNRVFVTTYEGNTNVPFKLIYGTTTYKWSGFGNSFDLGTGFTPNIYTMTLKFDTTNVTVDDNLKVIVG